MTGRNRKTRSIKKNDQERSAVTNQREESAARTIFCSWNSRGGWAMRRSGFAFGFWGNKTGRGIQSPMCAHGPMRALPLFPATFAGPYPNRRGEQPRPKRQFKVQDRWTYDPLPNSRQRMTNNTGHGRSLVPITAACHRCPCSIRSSTMSGHRASALGSCRSSSITESYNNSATG